MKIPIKYGLFTALGFIAWVLVTRSLISNTESVVFRLTGPLASIFHFLMTYFGLKALEREKGDKPRFKEALKTGVAIALVYGLTASLFFVVALFVAGVDWLAREGTTSTPQSLVLVLAFAGLILGALILGLLYSTVIAFFIAKRERETRESGY